MDTDCAPSSGRSFRQNWLLWNVSSLWTCDAKTSRFYYSGLPPPYPRALPSSFQMRRVAAALPPEGVPAPPPHPAPPGLAFLDVERIGIRNSLCSPASAAPAGPSRLLHPGRSHKTSASPAVPEKHLLRGCPHHPRLALPVEYPQGLAWASSSALARKSKCKGFQYGVGSTFWDPLTLPSPPPPIP